MESELAALASLAASAVVSGLATAGWESAQRAIGDLWRRAHPERADTVVAELGEARADVLAARRDGDERAERELVGEWQTRLRRLLATHPEVLPDLRRIVDEMGPPERRPDRRGGISVTAHASGGSRINVAGRDLTVDGR
ncbi:hypothetical protein AB0A99_06200 [Streptomyces fradiae]|uniref:hypothetical protein n=1 Tax=Streptomyces fradiae TaxID=1906 RepID=UPI0033D9CE6C